MNPLMIRRTRKIARAWAILCPLIVVLDRMLHAVLTAGNP